MGEQKETARKRMKTNEWLKSKQGEYCLFEAQTMYAYLLLYFTDSLFHLFSFLSIGYIQQLVLFNLI